MFESGDNGERVQVDDKEQVRGECRVIQDLQDGRECSLEEGGASGTFHDDV